MKQIIVVLISCVLLSSCVERVKEQPVEEKKSDWLKVYPIDESKKETKPVYNDEDVDTDSWYGQGHIDPDNSNIFIVNDRIKVVGKPYGGQFAQKGGGDVMYNVFVNGKEIPDVWKVHSDCSSLKQLIDEIESSYTYETTNHPKKEPFQF